MAHEILQPIIDEIQPYKDAADAAEALLDKLAQQILHAPTLEQAQEIASAFRKDRVELADAVVRNTPAEPPVEPPTT